MTTAQTPTVPVPSLVPDPVEVDGWTIQLVGDPISSVGWRPEDDELRTRVVINLDAAVASRVVRVEVIDVEFTASFTDEPWFGELGLLVAGACPDRRPLFDWLAGPGAHLVATVAAGYWREPGWDGGLNESGRVALTRLADELDESHRFENRRTRGFFVDPDGLAEGFVTDAAYAADQFDNGTIRLSELAWAAERDLP